MNNVQVKEALSRQEMKQFVKFPFALYANNPNWVPPLISDEMATLDRHKNPAFINCETKYWMAYINGNIVGRIAGIINRSYIEKWGNKYTRFGWLDFIDDEAVSGALIETVENWALEMKMEAVHGPLGFTDFDPEGILVHGFDELASMTTIYNFPYYPIHLEKLGYRKDVDWLEYEIKIPEKIPERIELFSIIVEKRYNLRSLKVSSSRGLLPYAQNIFDLLNTAYKGLYGVVKLNKEQVDLYIKQYFTFIRPDYVSVILDTNNKVAAFAISIPSLSKALQKANGKLWPFGFFYFYKAFKRNEVADLYLVAVRPDLQGKGVNSMLIRDLATTFIKEGILKAITHPALEKNNKVLALWKDFETRLIKRRRCYIKIITGIKPEL